MENCPEIYIGVKENLDSLAYALKEEDWRLRLFHESGSLKWKVIDHNCSRYIFIASSIDLPEECDLLWDTLGKEWIVDETKWWLAQNLKDPVL